MKELRQGLTRRGLCTVTRGRGLLKSYVFLIVLAVWTALSGCQGDAPPVQKVYPVITVEETLEIGDVNVGYYQEREFEVQNTGGALLTIDEISIVEEECYPQDTTNFFELLDPPAEGSSIAAGGALTFTIRFSAYMESKLTCPVLFVSNDDDNPELEVSVEAEGVISVISVEPSNLSFESVDVGESKTKKITISNAGEGHLKILDLYYEGLNDVETEFLTPTLPSDFNLGETIVPGRPIEVSITYAPQDGEADDGNLVIVSDDPKTKRLSVPINGNGVPNLPPTVTLVLPTQGDTVYANAPLTLSAIVQDNKDPLEDIRIFWDSLEENRTLCSGSDMTLDSASGTATCNASLSETGEQTIRIFATDTDSNTTLVQVSVTVWNEETPLEYSISGSDKSSIYAITADDNMEILVKDKDTGDITGTCAVDMDDSMHSQSAQPCSAKYGDTLIVRVYDRYGPGFTVPMLYLWYGVNDDWNQAIIPTSYSYEGDEIPEEFDPYGCEPRPVKAVWYDEETNPDQVPADDCLVYEDEIVINIPPVEESEE